MKSQSFITVHHYELGEIRPSCSGCLPTGVPSALVLPVPAHYRVIGAAFTLDLCTHCAVNLIKSLAARFVMYERSATRDLLDFFAADLSRPKRRQKRRKSRVIKTKLKMIDVQSSEK